MKISQSPFPLLVTLLLTIFGCLSCSSDDDNKNPKPEAAVTPASLTFAADGAEAQTLSVKANVKVNVVSGASWCRVIPVSENTGPDKNYSVSCDPYSLAEPRSTNIKIMADGVELSAVTVTQNGYSAPEPDPDPAVTALTPAQVYDRLGLGWNLGNQLDAHVDGVSSETCWGNPAATQATMDAVKRAGFKSVRIPVTWMGHIGSAPDYPIEAAWLDRVAEIVGYAENAGLAAIINIHHDGADSSYWLDILNASKDDAVNQRVEDELAAIWRQVAAKFADKGDFLIFESMNEIHDGGWGWGANRNDGGKQYRTFNHWQQVFVDAVRGAGGMNTSRWLGIPTYCTNIDLGANLVLPKDPSGRLMVAVHCYEPYEYTLSAKYSEWGHTGGAALKDKSDEKTLVAELDKVVTRWISKGTPVYIGEFGCVHRATERAEAFRKYYLEYYTKAASDRKIPMIYWDNGASGTGNESGGLINHGTGSYINNAEEIVSVMTRGFYDTGVTLDGIYNNAPQ